MKNKKNIKIITMILSIIAIIAVGTYAWLTWASSQNTELTTTIDNILEVEFTTGNNINATNLGPILNPEIDGEITTFSVRNKTSNDIAIDIKLTITSIANELKSESFKYDIYSSDSENGTYTLIARHGFTDTIVGDNKVGGETIPKKSTMYFKFIVYIDGSIENNANVMGKSFTGQLYVVANEKEPNAPDLVDGLIPVKYDSANSRWVKADSTNTNNDWYNYSNKLWANAVLVSSTNRSSYISANVNTPIPESDVLAYYVWIPRYKYRVWNINKVMGTDSYNAETKGIDIMFENGKETTGTIRCTNYSFNAINNINTRSETCSGSNGEYYTHPAFTFGSDELTGIWVGKFEISSETPDVQTTRTDETLYYDGGGYVTNLTVRIKPNVRSWRYNPVSNHWKVIHDMQISNNIYGLTTDTTEADSHMIKNIEWGAVTYLTHSKYGICDSNTCGAVYKNNSSSFITGNSGTEELSGAISGTTLAYNENKKEISVNGGTPLSLSAPTNDATYPWTQSNGIWTSGNAEAVSTTSSLVYNFTNSSNAVMKLVFSVSCYFGNYFRIYLDGTEIMHARDVNRGTEATNLIFDTFLYEIPSGTHTIEAVFDFISDEETAGLNKAFIKSLDILEGATINITHTNELGGQMASTTHNESGIYDMAGGTQEFVMANMSSVAGSYTYYTKNAGTNFTYGNDTIKYIDRYAYSDTNNGQKDFNRSILGDAIGEAAKDAYVEWNDDYGYMFYDTNPWFYRGGQCISTESVGLFYMYPMGGGRTTSTTRAVLVSLD